MVACRRHTAQARHCRPRRCTGHMKDYWTTHTWQIKQSLLRPCSTAHTLHRDGCTRCRPPCARCVAPPCPLTRSQAPWTAEEDALLLSLYATHTLPHWLLIAKHIPRCTDNACSKRYHNALDLQLKKDEWMDAEDMMLLKLTVQLSSKWMQVGHAMGCSGLGCHNQCVPHAPLCAWLTPADGPSWSASSATHRPHPTHK